MKKVLSTLLAVCLVFTAIPVVRSGAASNELLREDFESANIVKYNGQVKVLQSSIENVPDAWYAIDTPDATSSPWYAPTIEDEALSINQKSRITKKIGDAGFAKKGETYIVNFKAKNSGAAQTLWFYLTSISLLSGYNSRASQAISKSDVYQNYSVEITLNEDSYPDNECFVFSIYNPSAAAGTVQIDDLRVRKQEPAINSGLIMDGDFEATEKLDTYKYNNGISSTLDTGKWYSSPSGAVTVENDAEHGNYISLSNAGRIAQKLPNVKQNDGVVITFKAKWNATPQTNQFWFYVTPASVAHAYDFRGFVPLSTEWKEYTIIYNPEGESSEQVSLGTTGTDYNTEDFVFLLYSGAAGNAVSIDDVRVDSLDPFASNDLGDAQLTGVSMRGQSGTLPTAIRWKNAIRKDFVANGIGDWKVTEYGALVAGTEKLAGSNLTVETENTLTGVAFQQSSNTLKLFDETDEHNIFSLALSGIQADNYGKELTVRPYAKISNGQKAITVYGEERSNSLFDACHAVLAGSNESDIAVVKGILTAEEEIKTAYLAKFADDAAKLN